MLPDLCRKGEKKKDLDNHSYWKGMSNKSSVHPSNIIEKESRLRSRSVLKSTDGASGSYAKMADQTEGEGSAALSHEEDSNSKPPLWFALWFGEYEKKEEKKKTSLRKD